MIDKQAEFEDWLAKWDKAVADDVFADDDDEAAKPSGKGPDFFGQLPTTAEDVPLNECDTKYWREVAALAGRPLKEDSAPIAVKAQRLSKAQNPVMPNTTAHDQDVIPTPNWSDGKELRELSDLKASLEKLEAKLNAKEAMGDSGADIQKKIDVLKKQLDDLSQSLIPPDGPFSD